MSRFFLAIGEGAGALDVEAALARCEFAPFDAVAAHREPALVAAVAARWTEPEDAGTPPVVVADDFVVAWDGRLDDRDALAAALGVAADAPSPVLALEALRRWGRDAPRRLLGDFAFVAVERRGRSVFAARDRFGVRPLVWARRGELTAFASTAGLVTAVLDLPRRPDLAAVAWALGGAFVGQEGRTLYDGVRAVPPGSTLATTRLGEPRVARWFTPEAHEVVTSRSEADHRERVLEALRAAVHDRTRGSAPIGAEASGGLDSSTCIALATRDLAARGRPAPTLVHMRASGFACDEGEPVAELARRVGAEVVEADAGAHAFEPGARSEIDLTDVWCATSRALFEALASRGARVALTGDGSDELQSKWGLDVEDALLRRAPGEAARFAGLGRGSAFGLLTASPWRRLARGLARVAVPVHWLAPRQLRLRIAALPPWLSERGRALAAEGTSMHHALGQQMVHPSPMRRAGFAELVHNPSITWIGPTNQAFASALGIDLVHPFLDGRVVAAFLELPTALRTSTEHSKPLLRRAMASSLPAGIVWRYPPADYSPLYEAAFAKAQVEWLDLVRMSRLADLGLVDGARFADAVREGFTSGWLGFPLRTALRLESWLHFSVNAWPLRDTPC